MTERTDDNASRPPLRPRRDRPPPLGTAPVPPPAPQHQQVRTIISGEHALPPPLPHRTMRSSLQHCSTHRHSMPMARPLSASRHELVCATVGHRLAAQRVPSTPAPMQPTQPAAVTVVRREPSPTQELVSIDNPRPQLLRTSNEYFAVPPTVGLENHRTDCPLHRTHTQPQRRLTDGEGRALPLPHHGCEPGTSRRSTIDFDRAKVHLVSVDPLHDRRHHRPVSCCTSTRDKVKSWPHQTIQQHNGEIGHIRPLVPADKQLGRLKPLLPPARTQLSATPSPPSTTEHTKQQQASTGAKGSSSGSALLLGSSSHVTATTGADKAASGSSAQDIICRDCGRCRCVNCATPQRIPERWVCGETCLCSLDSIVDAVSCMTCVKACHYHMHDDATPADSHPCSCEAPGRAARWACLGAAAVFLPCIWCYLPLKACAAGLEAIYARASVRGCTCTQRHPYLERRHAEMVIAQQPGSTKKL